MCWLSEYSILQLFTIVVFIVYNTDTFQNLPLLMEFPGMLQLNYVTDNFYILFYFNDWEFWMSKNLLRTFLKLLYIEIRINMIMEYAVLTVLILSMRL